MCKGARENRIKDRNGMRNEGNEKEDKTEMRGEMIERY